MKETTVIKYVKRTQKDYTISFKLQVVAQAEREELTFGGAALKYGVQNSSTVTNWLRKFGNFDWQTQKLFKFFIKIRVCLKIFYLKY